MLPKRGNGKHDFIQKNSRKINHVIGFLPHYYLYLFTLAYCILASMIFLFECRLILTWSSQLGRTSTAHEHE
jgi:hypothetical protein